jgi:hypothetical protein
MQDGTKECREQMGFTRIQYQINMLYYTILYYTILYYTVLHYGAKKEPTPFITSIHSP